MPASRNIANLGDATGANDIYLKIALNPTVIDADYTIPANTNAGTFGPITIATGVTVTVSNNSTWTVV